MTTKLTPEQAKLILDSLFAMPDKEKKPKEKPAKKQAEPKFEATPVQRNRNYAPALGIIEIRQQVCSTCGSRHEYVVSRRVRFEARAKGDLHTAIELPTIVPENLPRRVDYTYETTNVCPTCLKISSLIEDYMAVERGPVQQELFHG